MTVEHLLTQLPVLSSLLSYLSNRDEKSLECCGKSWHWTISNMRKHSFGGIPYLSPLPFLYPSLSQSTNNNMMQPLSLSNSIVNSTNSVNKIASLSPSPYNNHVQPPSHIKEFILPRSNTNSNPNPNPDPNPNTQFNFYHVQPPSYIKEFILPRSYRPPVIPSNLLSPIFSPNSKPNPKSNSNPDPNSTSLSHGANPNPNSNPNPIGANLIVRNRSTIIYYIKSLTAVTSASSIKGKAWTGREAAASIESSAKVSGWGVFAGGTIARSGLGSGLGLELYTKLLSPFT
jgi:hypothetical protein